MAGTSLDTLFIPFETGEIVFGGKTLFLGAAFHPFLKQLKDVHLYQPFKPLVDGLTQGGYQTVTDLPLKDIYDLVLIHCPKQVEEAQFWLAYAVQHLNKNGVLAISAANDAGGGRLDGWMKELGFGIHQTSKYKSRVVWGVRPDIERKDMTQKWIQKGSLKSINFGDGIELKSQIGLFSWDRLDKGSAVLIEHFSKDLKGTGADFGAGIGVLSHALLLTPNAIENLHIVEADARALNCSRENLTLVKGRTELVFHWHDLTKPLFNISPLDFIFMNPPFHMGKKNDIGLGLNFIQNAVHHLRKGGVLMMVANVHLPYENYLKSLFSRFDIIAQKNGFKIIRAVK